MPQADSFKATAFYVWKPNRPYRVYVRGDRIYFIRRVPSPPNAKVATAIAAQFGLVGGLAMAAAGGLRAEKGGNLVADDDPQPAESLLSQHQDNFVLSPSEVRQARIEARGKLMSYGPHAGRWHFTGKDQDEMVLLFEEPTEMAAAVAALTPVLGSALQVLAPPESMIGKPPRGETKGSAYTAAPDELVIHGALPAEQAELVGLMKELTALLADLVPAHWQSLRCEIRGAAPGQDRTLVYRIADAVRPAEAITEPGNQIHLAASRLVRKLSPSLRSFPGLDITMTRQEDGTWYNNVRLVT